MKTRFKYTCVLAAFYSIHFFAHGQNEYIQKLIKAGFAPPGTIQLYDSIFLDETEMTNIAWLEYTHYLAKDSSEALYFSQLPDTTCWVNYQPVSKRFEPFLEHYFRYPGFRYFPVVGVSHQQAQGYCRWRAAAVNATFNSDEYRKKHKAMKDYEVTIEYRLPTKREWEFAARAGLNPLAFPYGLDTIIHRIKPMNLKKSPVCIKCLDSLHIAYNKDDIVNPIPFNVAEDYYFRKNHRYITCAADSNDAPLQYIYNNPPNARGFYNMIGNVAEMISEKGVAKGGSFQDLLANISVEKDFYYNEPSILVGFRCIGILHVRPKAHPKPPSTRRNSRSTAK